MKKEHLILVCSVVFTLLFYNESIGLNLSIFGFFILALIYYFFRNRFDHYSYFILTITAALSCIAFAWYGDFVSFVAVFLSIILLQFKVNKPKLKIILAMPIVFINSFASIVRIFLFRDWLPARKTENFLIKKMVAYFLIPSIFIFLFCIVYSFGSDSFADLFFMYTLDINLPQAIFVVLLGFYFSFSFWNFWVPEIFVDNNSKLNNDFNDNSLNESVSTFSLLDLDINFERKSGEITLFLLNLLLVVFIGMYNYEQFFQETITTTLSAATHERVNAVVFSIIMAVGVVLFYFKGSFNFDAKAEKLKVLTKIWILLNGILIISTCVKNAEYILNFGLTYKRLGVFAFLVLAIIGLYFTFMKIQNKKTNAYLFNQMFWCFYGTILLCSFVNWGGIITSYNISVNRGVEPIFLSNLNFNDAERRTYFLKNKLDGEYSEIEREGEIERMQSDSFLSKALYYEFLSK